MQYDKINKILSDFENKLISKQEAHDLLGNFYESKIPIWLSDFDYEFSKELWKESKIQALKYLEQIAKENEVDNSMRWALQFTKQY